MKAGFSIHPFVAFLLVSMAVGLAFGLDARQLVGAVEKGIGDLMSGLLILLVLGAMFGKVIAETGAAQRIAAVLLRLAGPAYIQWAMALIGFIIGIPLFYGVGFVLLVPLVFSVCYSSKLPPVFVGLPLLAALSVTHGFLPPHPSPSALVVQFGASMGKTLVYGLLIALPAIIIAGPLLARLLRGIRSEPLEAFHAPVRQEDSLPGTFTSLFVALLPIVLLALSAILPSFLPATDRSQAILAFMGSPSVVLLFALVTAGLLLGTLRNIGMKEMTTWCGSAAKDIAPVLLIVAGSGALKQVLTVSGVSDRLAASLQDLPFPPLVLGWLMAAILRACVGSATVAGLTTAGIMAAYLQQTGTDPNLMVLSIGAGSLAFSHVNDSGFWMYKEYFNLGMRDTFLSWSVMETLVAIVGLIGVLILNFVIT